MICLLNLLGSDTSFAGNFSSLTLRGPLLTGTLHIENKKNEKPNQYKGSLAQKGVKGVSNFVSTQVENGFLPLVKFLSVMTSLVFIGKQSISIIEEGIKLQLPWGNWIRKGLKQLSITTNNSSNPSEESTKASEKPEELSKNKAKPSEKPAEPNLAEKTTNHQSVEVEKVKPKKALDKLVNWFKKKLEGKEGMNLSKDPIEKFIKEDLLPFIHNELETFLTSDQILLDLVKCSKSPIFRLNYQLKLELKMQKLEILFERLLKILLTLEENTLSIDERFLIVERLLINKRFASLSIDKKRLIVEMLKKILIDQKLHELSMDKKLLIVEMIEKMLIEENLTKLSMDKRLLDSTVRFDPPNSNSSPIDIILDSKAKTLPIVIPIQENKSKWAKIKESFRNTRERVKSNPLWKPTQKVLTFISYLWLIYRLAVLLKEVGSIGSPNPLFEETVQLDIEKSKIVTDPKINFGNENIPVDNEVLSEVYYISSEIEVATESLNISVDNEVPSGTYYLEAEIEVATEPVAEPTKIINSD
jgi:hypothetical protein